MNDLYIRTRPGFSKLVLWNALVVASVLCSSATAYADDPTTADCLTANDRSIALRNQHRLKDARAELLTCAASACPADIRNECVRRVAQVNSSMPTVVFEVKDSAGNDLSGVKVSIDGQLLAGRLEGTALSIDPGEHTFLFETAGQPPLRKQFVIREGEKGRREKIVFGATATKEPEKKAEEEKSLRSVETATSSRFGTQKTLALVAAGVGVIGLGMGTVFGLQAKSKHDDAQNICPGQCTDQSGVDAWNSAKSAGNLATIGIVIGVAGLAGGAVLWFTAKPASTESSGTMVGLAPGMFQLKGSF